MDKKKALLYVFYRSAFCIIENLIFSDHSGKAADQNQQTQHDSIPSKYGKIMLFDVIHEEANDKDRNQESGNHADQEHCRFHSSCR